MFLIFAVLAGVAARVTATVEGLQKPGMTQTIMLVKGGYGVDASLLSSFARTSHRRALAAPGGVAEPSALLSATNTASALTKELESAVLSAKGTAEVQHAEEMKMLKLSTEVADDEGKLKQFHDVMQGNLALGAKVKQLTADLAAERAKGAQALQEKKELQDRNAALERRLAAAEAEDAVTRHPAPAASEATSAFRRASRRVAAGVAAADAAAGGAEVEVDEVAEAAGHAEEATADAAPDASGGAGDVTDDDDEAGGDDEE